MFQLVCGEREEWKGKGNETLLTVVAFEQMSSSGFCAGRKSCDGITTKKLAGSVFIVHFSTFYFYSCLCYFSKICMSHKLIFQFHLGIQIICKSLTLLFQLNRYAESVRGAPIK